MKTIVLGYDESPEAGRALDRAAQLALALGARVVVASIAPALQPAGHGIGPYDPADPPELHREMAHSAAETLIERGVSAEAISGLGDASEAIISVADEHEADLIVVGMSHHPHVSRFLGGVSEDVAHHAHCDVLLVH
jgi:nucleotide-binding universal stress UspA family protein